MKYNFCYKYYELKMRDINIIIELNFDNTLSSGTFGAHTNTLFRDAEGDLGRAAGIGKTEDDAILMCLSEVNEALQNNNENKNYESVTALDLKEINLPYRITFVLGNNNYTTVYVKKEANNLTVLTDKNKFVTPLVNDVVYTLEENMKNIKHSDDKNFTKEYLQHNEFYPVFKSLTK